MYWTSRIRGSVESSAAFLLCIYLVGCSAVATTPDRSRLDGAIKLFIDGRYAEVIVKLEDLRREGIADEQRIELCYYLGRAYVETGAIEKAIETFRLAVTMGDTGASLEYYNSLRHRVSTDPALLALRPSITRADLAGAIETIVGMAGGAGDTPLQRAAEWIRPLPDGEAHADAVVTEAAFYAIICLVRARMGMLGPLDSLTLLRERAVSPVSGRTAVTVLEEIAAQKVK